MKGTSRHFRPEGEESALILLSLNQTFWRSSVLSRFGGVIPAIAVIAAMLFIVGCPTQASIADINKDPGRYVGKDVSIHGTASDSFGALGNGVFQIDDGTGRMWVYSQNFGVPGNGSKVAVIGHVEQGFAFGGRSFGVILRETEAWH
jgi:hypothetical protein